MFTETAPHTDCLDALIPAGVRIDLDLQEVLGRMLLVIYAFREHDVLNEDVAQISPFTHANPNVLGRYSSRHPGWRRPAAPARPGHRRH